MTTRQEFVFGPGTITLPNGERYAVSSFTVIQGDPVPEPTESKLDERVTATFHWKPNP